MSAMESLDDLLETLQQLEMALHDPKVRHSERTAQLLAEDFVEFGSSGQIYSKATILPLLSIQAPRTISASRFSVRRIAPDAALLTYLACHPASANAFSLRSSVWQFQDGQWRILFHQGTPCAPPA